MNVVRCTGAERHFFDGDIYSVCPYCSAPAGNASDKVASAVKEISEKDTKKETKKETKKVTKKQKKLTKSKIKFFSIKEMFDKKQQRIVSEKTDDVSQTQDPEISTPDDVALFSDQRVGLDIEEEDNAPTVDIWQTAPVLDGDPKLDPEPISPNINIYDGEPMIIPDHIPPIKINYQDIPSIEKDNQKVSAINDQNAAAINDQKVALTDNLKVSSIEDKKVSSEPISYFSASEESRSRSESDEDSQSRSESDEESLGSLLEKVKNASASSEGKTMSYFSAITYKANEAAKPQTLSAHVDPVVGWLVVIQGEHFGESFTLGAGKNSIGRNESNRIVLDRDPAVSREKHALITYEPKHRRFYFKLGDSSGLAYVNDEYITETKQLSAKDTIELGNSKFVFVPLCGEDFTWEDYLKG